MGEVKSIGDRALWLDHGKLRELGPADRVSDSYLAALAEKSRPSRQPAAPHSDHRPTLPAVSDLQLDWLDNLTNCDGRRGDGRARIYGFVLLDALGRPATQLVPRDSYVAKLSFEALDFLERPQAGVLIRNHLGIAFSGVATLRSNGPIAALSAGEQLHGRVAIYIAPVLSRFFFFLANRLYDARSTGNGQRTLRLGGQRPYAADGKGGRRSVRFDACDRTSPLVQTLRRSGASTCLNSRVSG